MPFPDKSETTAIEPYVHKRDELGRLLPGQPAIYPAGRPKKPEAFRKFRPRAKELMNQYSIVQIRAMIDNKEIEKLHAYDSIILATIARTFAKGGNELRVFLEYLEGKIKDEDGQITNIYNQTMWVDNYVDPKRG